jgi:dienelactone hydrolase
MFQSREKIAKTFWRVTAITAGLTVVLMSGINGALMDTGVGNVLEFIIGALFGSVAVLIFALFVAGLIWLIAGMPLNAIVVIGGALLALWYLNSNRLAELMRGLLDTGNWSWPFSLPDALSVLPLASIVLAVASLSGLMVLLIGKSMRRLDPPLRIGLWVCTIGFTGIAIGVIVRLSSEGADPFPDDGVSLSASTGSSELADPATRGNYSFERLTYGAGANARRPEFGAERDLESRVVDISALLPEWKDFKQQMRERYWGISLGEAPLNGQVWAPEGEGAFPLVLIVHGNHGMEDYSDSGYAYLGELLASRGFITVSVDENYINGTWSGDFEGKEMAARAGLLLEHLALWRDWNGMVGHPFYARVDMDNIALMGHSRGGEAVSIAYAFNELPHFPDDATVEFDYGFDIRSLVAIAQIDQRYHRRVEIEDVNFFTIHGSYDSDEPAYHGLRQLNRIDLDDQDYYINAGVYLHGANHGQFNTGWGRTDYSPPDSWRLNLAPIIPGDEQRKVASVYIAAFLEATLHGDERYIALLKDPRVGAGWLPAQTYVQQYTDSTFRPLADFEEDLDVTTATQSGATITANALVVWREEDLEHRDEFKQGSNAVVVGWRDAGADYSLNLASADDISAERALVFAISGSTEKLPAEDDEEEEEEDEDVEPVIADFSVELRDAVGNTSVVRASEYAGLVPPVRVRFLKNEAMNEELYNADWEPVLQFVEIPFNAFVSRNPEFDLSTTTTIRFRFDQAAEGLLILDKIGTMSLTPLQQKAD